MRRSMTLRSRLFISAIVICAVFAAGPKRRAVAPVLPTGLATLAGTVADASTDAPVAQVRVIGAGKFITDSDSSGHFTLKMSTGRDVPLTLMRSGYESTTVN